MASIQDHPYAMAIDSSQPDHDQRTVRSWAAAKLEGARPFMIPQTRPFLIVPCRTYRTPCEWPTAFQKRRLLVRCHGNRGAHLARISGFEVLRIASNMYEFV